MNTVFGKGRVRNISWKIVSSHQPLLTIGNKSWVFHWIQFNCWSWSVRFSQKTGFSPKCCKSSKDIFKKHFVNFSELAWRDHVDDDVDCVHPTIPGVECHRLKRKGDHKIFHTTMNLNLSKDCENLTLKGVTLRLLLEVLSKREAGTRGAVKLA